MSTERISHRASYPGEWVCICGKRRWIVERTIAWLGNYRRVLIRWEHNVRHYLAFVHVACLMIVARQF
jgi:transposase